MHLYEKQLFICDDTREPYYGLALGTNSGGVNPRLPWLAGEWTPVTQCSSFHFGQRHFGLAIGPHEQFDPEMVRPILTTMAELTYPADYMSFVLPEGGLIVVASKPVASSGLVVAYSSWFEGQMQVGMSRYCGPVLWFGTLGMSKPPSDLLAKIDRYARGKKAAAWGPGRIYLVDEKTFEECDCDVEPDLWHEEMRALEIT